MDHKKEFCKVVGQLAGKYGRHEIFTDFCEAAALSLRRRSSGRRKTSAPTSTS